MNIQYYLLLLFIATPVTALAQDGMELMDQHSFVHLMVDELEITDLGNGNNLSWNTDISVGGDLHQFWAKTQGHRSDTAPDRTELQLLYSHAILPFWDLQSGVRRDFDPAADRDWAVVAIRGVAPYFLDVEAELFLGEGGQSGLRVTGEYALLLTQRLILTPEIELIAYGSDEPNRFLGSGVSEIAFDLRLRYELKREFAPYVGLSWRTLSGNTRDLALAAGRSRRETELLVGVRAWF